MSREERENLAFAFLQVIEDADIDDLQIRAHLDDMVEQHSETPERCDIARAIRDSTLHRAGHDPIALGLDNDNQQGPIIPPFNQPTAQRPATTTNTGTTQPLTAFARANGLTQPLPMYPPESVGLAGQGQLHNQYPDLTIYEIVAYHLPDLTGGTMLFVAEQLLRLRNVPVTQTWTAEPNEIIQLIRDVHGNTDMLRNPRTNVRKGLSLSRQREGSARHRDSLNRRCEPCRGKHIQCSFQSGARVVPCDQCASDNAAHLCTGSAFQPPRPGSDRAGIGGSMGRGGNVVAIS